jgi:hypothetical protein
LSSEFSDRRKKNEVKILEGEVVIIGKEGRILIVLFGYSRKVEGH